MDAESLSALSLFQLKDKLKKLGLPDEFSKPACVKALLTYQRDCEAADLLTTFAEGSSDMSTQGISVQRLQSENEDLRRQLQALSLQQHQLILRLNSLDPPASSHLPKRLSLERRSPTFQSAKGYSPERTLSHCPPWQ